jgi:hypothetical protein
LRTYPVPEELFDALRVDKSIDRFSWIVDDYLSSKVRFKESQKNSGVEFGLVYKPGSNTDIFGYVRYIVPGSDAATKDPAWCYLYGINGTQLTASNYQSLLANDSFTLNLADYNGGNNT